VLAWLYNGHQYNVEYDDVWSITTKPNLEAKTMRVSLSDDENTIERN
jgi:hypothetical protein